MSDVDQIVKQAVDAYDGGLVQKIGAVSSDLFFNLHHYDFDEDLTEDDVLERIAVNANEYAGHFSHIEGRDVKPYELLADFLSRR